MRMKQGIIGLAAALIAVESFTDPIQVSVTGTANTTEMGYTAGQSYTFNWVVNDGYTGGSGDLFSSSYNRWHAETTADPLLWTSASGDGLSGSYSRPTGTSSAPRDFLLVDSGGLSLFAGNDDPSGSSLGLTVDATEVWSVYAHQLNIPGLDYSDTAYINPTSWLVDYAGTHALSSGIIQILDESSDLILFTPTSATIAIPEPSTIAFVGLFGGGLLFIRRYFAV